MTSRDCASGVDHGSRGAQRCWQVHSDTDVGRLRAATSGSVRVLGVDPWRDRNRAIDQLGFVPQSPHLYRGLTVRDHLTMASRARRSFDLAVARGHLEELGVPQHATVGRLSGGQQAQVMLSLALATRAKVLLLDEPVASLDPLARSEFLQLMQRTVRTGGATALLSSHIVADLAGVCDELIILGVGRVLLHGNLPEIFAWHAVVPGDAGSGPTIARFPDESGMAVSLVRLNAPVQHERVGLRRPTLDEIGGGTWSPLEAAAGPVTQGELPSGSIWRIYRFEFLAVGVLVGCGGGRAARRRERLDEVRPRPSAWPLGSSSRMTGDRRLRAAIECGTGARTRV